MDLLLRRGVYNRSKLHFSRLLHFDIGIQIWSLLFPRELTQPCMESRPVSKCKNVQLVTGEKNCCFANCTCQSLPGSILYSTMLKTHAGEATLPKNKMLHLWVTVHKNKVRACSKTAIAVDIVFKHVKCFNN